MNTPPRPLRREPLRQPPKYNTGLGASSETRQSRPPMRFEGVTARVFPLRANMFRLRSFVDGYLNVAPDLVRFEPLAPFVLMMVIDYGKMSAEYRNAGWLAQREVAFAIPLEWYNVVDGGRFEDTASVCPFIYVDDELSLSTGREVYGWPKVQVWVDKDVGPQIADPLAPQTLLSLATHLVPHEYTGDPSEARTLLEITQQQRSLFSRIPPDPSAPSNPISAMAQSMQSFAGFMSGVVEMFTRPPLSGYAAGSTSIDGLMATTRAFGASMSGYLRLNNVTLKQFRDVARTDYACYQAIVNSPMTVERVSSFGMLGDQAMAMGDPSGGFSIRIHNYSAQPIVESLGLEVSEEITLGESRASVLKPLFPYWVTADMEYAAGKRVCWRSGSSPWHTRVAATPDRSGSDAAQVVTSDRRDPPFFNTSLGGALQAVAGPYDFPDTTARVLPLLADPEKLQAFVTTYLNEGRSDNSDGAPYTFEAWGSYVYCLAMNHDTVTSESNDVGRFTELELSFCVPVRVFDDQRQLWSLGMVPVFNYLTTSQGAISSSEVTGRPTFRAHMTSAPDNWMSDGGASGTAFQSLLDCDTNVMPSTGVGAEMEFRTLVSITAAEFDSSSKHRIRADWGVTLLKEHQRLVSLKQQGPIAAASHDAGADGAGPSVLDLADSADEHVTDVSPHEIGKALALELLAREQPINFFSLKQFRDCEDPEKACYQAIVRLPNTIKRIHSLEEIDDHLHLRIHRFDNHPIVEMLGLIPKAIILDEGTVIDLLEPQRPFWIKLGMREELGENLCARTIEGPWTTGLVGLAAPDDPAPVQVWQGYFSQIGSRATDISLGMLDELGLEADEYATDSGQRLKRQNLKESMRMWEEGLDSRWSGPRESTDGSAEKAEKAKKEEYLSRKLAAAATELIEPQVLIESILSAEWEHWGQPRWYRRMWNGEAVEVKPEVVARSESVGSAERRAVRDEVSTRVPADTWKSKDGRWFSFDPPAKDTTYGPPVKPDDTAS